MALMASERHTGPVNDGDLPGEVISVSARCGEFITGAAATAAAAGAASRALPTPGVAAAAASLLIRASSTILCASEVVGTFAKFLASSLRLAVVDPAGCDSSCQLLVWELNGVE